MEPIECAINLSASDSENDTSMTNKSEANGGQDDMEKDLSSLKENLELALSEIKSSGSFMTQKALGSVVIPGLHVPGVGAIGLPITAENAKAMIQSCRMSPYGKGTETLVNETVRKSWQLDVNQFSLQNPLWEKQVGIFKDQAIAGLGLTTAKPEEVKVELYKLLIYEEGAFFLPHQDSEKADGMFATLVISLPSKHEGGEVIASHKGESLGFCTASNSEYGLSWAAWYADVMHEVKPVRSGYRIVLVYNLIHRPSAALIKFRGGKVGSLNKLFAAWTLAIENSKHSLQSWDSEVEDKCPAALVYLLDHQYSVAELSVARLKGVDRHRFVQLQEACLKNGCDIYLANIEKSVTGGVEDDDDYYGGYYGRGRSLNNKDYHPLEDVYEDSLELLHVVDTQGVVAGVNLSFSETMIIQDDAFKGDPDDEDYEGFTGNEGAHATHFYRPTGLLIVPKAVSFLFEIERLKKNQGDVKHIMEECERMLTQQSDETMMKKALAHVCSILAGLEYHADEEARERFIELILKRSLEFADFELFSRALLLNSYFSSSHIAIIAKAIADHGLNSIRSALDTKLKGTDSFGYGRRITLNLQLLYDVTRGYVSVCTQRNLTPSTEVAEWQQATFLAAVTEGLTGSESDGQKVAQDLKEMPILGSLEKIETWLLSHVENTTFTASLILSTKGLLGDDLDKNLVGRMIKGLLPRMIQSFKIEHEADLTFRVTLSGSSKFDRFGLGVWKRPERGSVRISPNLVIKLIKLANSENTDTKGIMNVLLKYANNVKGSAASTAFHELLFPVAVTICELIAQKNRPSTADEKDFIVELLKAYVNGYVRKVPPPPADWQSRTTIRCLCSDCMGLRRFIDDYESKVQDFTMPERRRKHLEQQLDRSYFTSYTIKNGSPHKLRVEKTNAAMLVSHYNAWLQRVRAAKSLLNQLCEKGPLEGIIGEGHYRAIFEHTNRQVPQDNPVSNTTNKNSRPTVQSMVPQKRSRLG